MYFGVTVVFFSDNSGKFMSHSPRRVCNKPKLKSDLYCPINEDLIYGLLIRLIKSLSNRKVLATGKTITF